MVKTLRKLRPIPQIFIMTPPPLNEPYPFTMNSTVINTIYSSLIRDIVEVTDAQLIDIFSAMNSNSSIALTCDGCHPNADGNQIIAETMYPIIKNAARPK
jgi:lysophospholipase L1-like esterase